MGISTETRRSRAPAKGGSSAGSHNNVMKSSGATDAGKESKIGLGVNTRLASVYARYKRIHLGGDRRSE